MKKIYDFARYLFPDIISKEIIYIDIPKHFKIWTYVTKFIVDEMINKIQQTYSPTKYNSEWYNKILLLFKKEVEISKFNSLTILPNQSGTLSNFNDLFQDCIIHNDIKQVLKETCQIDFGTKLLSLDINVIKPTKKFYLAEIENEIIIKWQEIAPDMKSLLSHSLVKYIPDEEEKEEKLNKMASSQSTDTEASSKLKISCITKQKKIIHLFKLFINQGNNFMINSYKGSPIYNLYNLIDEVIVQEIVAHINKFYSITDLLNNFHSNLNENDILNELSMLYEFTSNGKIFPDYDGNFHDLTEKNENKQFECSIYYGEKIPHQLIEIYDMILPDNKIRQRLLHPALKKNISSHIPIISEKTLYAQLNEKTADLEQDDPLYQTIIEYCHKYHVIEYFPKLMSKITSNFSPDFLKYSSILGEHRTNKILKSASEDISDETQLLGEAIVYNKLKQSGKYDSVEWASLAVDSKTEKEITYNNEIYYIKSSYKHNYCITCKSGLHEEIFKVEVTNRDSKYIKSPNGNKVIALVTRIKTNPRVKLFRPSEDL